jgi:hypothetical protein
MLILPPGHQREVANRGPLAGRERRLVAGVGVLVAVIIVAVVIGIAGGGSSTFKKGCLNISYASAVGNQTITRCGSEARATCQSLGTPGGFTGTVEKLFADQCRKFHLPVG